MLVDAQRALWFCRSIVATLGTRRYCNTGAKTRHGASARGQARLKHEINQLDGL